MKLFGSLLAFVVLIIAGTFGLYAVSARSTGGEAREFCAAMPLGADAERVRARARARGRSQGEFSAQQIRFHFPWWIDHAYECRLALDVNGRVASRVLHDCTWSGMQAGEARRRSTASGETADPVPDDVADADWVEVRTCAVVEP